MLTKLVLFLVVVYLAVAIAMFIGQRKLIYVPDAGGRVTPASVGLADIREIEIPGDDDGHALAWYGKAAPGQPTLLYFHGNAGSLSSRSERIRKYLARGRGMFMMSYRGYSGAPGAPSEPANVLDGLAAFDALVREGVAASDIIIYGESLGSGVAVQVAAKRKVKGLILDAPYTSLVDVAAGHYPWLPVRPMIFDRYESAKVIGAVRAPLLVIHGEQDEVIPTRMGRALFALANEPKEIVTFPDAGHADHYMFGSYDAVNGWIDRLVAKAAN